MSDFSPLALILIGFLMVVAGFLTIFMMVIGVIQTGFLLNFAGYGASFLGLLLGIIGVSQFTSRSRGDGF